MLRYFLSIVVLAGFSDPTFPQNQPQVAPNSPLWDVVPTEVTVGGCVAIEINSASRGSHDWMLRINDRKPQKLVDGLGPAVRYGGKTIVILAFDLMNPEGVRVNPTNPNETEIVPIFDEVGEVRLSLSSKGTTLGTKTVRVVPASPEAMVPLHLLYPVLVRNKGLSDSADGTWMQLITDHVFGVSPPITPEQMQQLRDELPIIMKHPDWAEIAEMLVGRLEARLHSRELIVREEGYPATIKKTIGELPPWPEIVTRCLEAKPRSPFARAMQRNIRSTVNDIRILDAKRHGQDVISIIKSSASHEDF